MSTNTNTLSKETELRLADFLTKTVDPESLAKKIRHVNYLLGLCLMCECETLQQNIQTAENGYFWLNELAEILDPYFDAD
ncbi:hypothetical protein [Flavobacterium hercynium]|uniref:Uncharacterized protein n=1 Tax=Flavobacterium hercynium TaxID=387094 RepID=A0A226HGL8_9FLAO|nr:hypothetical protein [Flavobacterium hercynium]OXA92791.1 hypothetical protein B0A66_08415 [Flavobacterium hercynium]PAM92219.1 hypothetical protein B4N84_25770 [Flavobacterium sp. IR1]SMP02137.1 hypothetical protein SAMN06265346_101112 [Flavobacterium hercynium]